MKKSFTCKNCGSLPPTLVFDGVTLGIQVRKLKKFQDRMQLVLGRRSKTILKGTVFRQRTFIKSFKNRKILKKSAIREEWPDNEVDNDNEYVPSNKRIKKDRGMEQFRKMMAKQDKS